MENPGWRFFDGDGGYGEWKIVDADGQRIADVIGDSAEAWTRGHKMAAAPALEAALLAYLKAQRRMLEKWADGDGPVKAGLWRDLHQCEAAAQAALDAAEGLEPSEAKPCA